MSSPMDPDPPMEASVSTNPETGNAPGAVFTAISPEGTPGLQHIRPFSDGEIQALRSRYSDDSAFIEWLEMINAASSVILNVSSRPERLDERMMLVPLGQSLCVFLREMAQNPSALHRLHPGESLSFLLNSVVDDPCNANVCTLVLFLNDTVNSNLNIIDLHMPVATIGNPVINSNVITQSCVNILNDNVHANISPAKNYSVKQTCYTVGSNLPNNVITNVSKSMQGPMGQNAQNSTKNTKKQDKKGLEMTKTTNAVGSAPSGPSANKKLRAESAAVTTNQSNNESDFQPVKGRKAARPQDIVKNGTIQTFNKFNALDNNQHTNNNVDMEESEVQAPVKVIKPEPLFLKMDANWRPIISDLDKLLGANVTKKVTGELLKILPRDIDQYRTIQRFLSDKKCEFFGMKPKNERPKKVLIKGVPCDTPIEDVKAELARLGYSVNRVSLLKHNKTNRFLPMFLCDIFINDTFKMIFELRTFLGFVVTVVPYTYRGVKQCFNCQRFNHSSDTCFFNPVCVKCAGAHSSKTCTVPRDQVLCCNCKGNHTANYRGCPRSPQNVQAAKAQIKTIRSTPVTEGVSYSSQAAKGSNQGQDQKTPLPKDNTAATVAQKATTAPPPSDQSNFPPLPTHNRRQPGQTALSLPNRMAATPLLQQPDIINSILNIDVSRLDAIINKFENLYAILEKIDKIATKHNTTIDGAVSIVQQVLTNSALPGAPQ